MILRVALRAAALAAVLTTAGLPTGCSSAYYRTMETFGQHKRDILVDRVAEARDDQEAAKEQFQDALEEFSVLVGFEGGELRKVYDRLNGELKACEARAEDVDDRIRSIEKVAADLFDEWEKELEQYGNPELRRASEAKLDQTKGRYGQLISAMHRAEGKMRPVLQAFQDQVLFLKHNLNAQAIASLQGNVATLEADIAELINEMEASISEANAFIETMGQL